MLQRLAGLLKFIGRGVVPGRSHTQHLDMKFRQIRQHHHTNVDQDVQGDCNIWLKFLSRPNSVCRPFADFSVALKAGEMNWNTDASGNPQLGCGSHFNDRCWFSLKWNEEFMLVTEPSIEYLELYAVTIGVLLWTQHVKNRRIIIFCDNESVISMINSTSSSCRNCLKLLRMITMHALDNNTRICARRVVSLTNKKADYLPRRMFDKFWALAPVIMSPMPEPIPHKLWPMTKVWCTN